MACEEVVLLSSEDETDDYAIQHKEDVNSNLNLSDLSDSELDKIRFNSAYSNSVSNIPKTRNTGGSRALSTKTASNVRTHSDDAEDSDLEIAPVPKSSKSAAPRKPASKAKEDRAAKAAATAANKAAKTLEKAREKALKSAETANKKANNISDCLQHLTAFVDSTILNSLSNSGNLLTQLQEAGIKHSINPNPTPCSIFWRREQVEYYVDGDVAEVRSRSTSKEEDDAILVLTMEEIIPIAHSNNITDFVDGTLRSLKKKRLTLIVFGSSEYFRVLALKDKQKFRQQCTGKAANKRGSSQNDSDTPIFSPSEFEEFKVRLMLLTQCSLWPVETTEELGKTVARLTKAVAERPFKEERFEQVFDFYAPEASGSIKVNKEGLGLTRLWQQQIMQFPLVALETSQAIVSQYPTPVSLHEAYRDLDERSASLLLQDIPVRRHAGPISSTRKVGPELSKKIHKFMTTKDGGETL